MTIGPNNPHSVGRDSLELSRAGSRVGGGVLMGLVTWGKGREGGIEESRYELLVT